MTNKPTYEELELRILELERAISECNCGASKDRPDLADSKHIAFELDRAEERYSLALEANKDGLWDWDINTGEVYYSPGYIAMLGYSSNEDPLQIESWSDHIHPADKELALKANNDCVENRCSDFQVQFRMQAKNGEWRWILSRGMAIVRDENGRATRMIGTHTDITDRKLTEEALLESEQKYRNIFENVQETFFEVSIDGIILEVSPSVAHQSKGHYKREDLIGKRLFDLYVDYGERDKVLALLEKQDFITNYEIKIKSLDGSIFDCAISARMLRDVNDRPIKIIGSLIDITDRKRGEEALEKRMIALVQPLDNPESITFDELFDIKDIQRLQDEIAEALGLASIITATDGTPITAPSNFNRLCSEIIRETEVGCANCFRSDSTIGQVCAEGPTVMKCLSGGLWDAGAGISVGGRHIANWLIGQVRDESQGDEEIRDYARAIGADEETAVEAFFEVPTMARSQFEKISKVLFTLANQLSTIAFQNVQQARFISKQKQSEEALRLTRFSIEHASDAVYWLTPDARIIDVNEAGYQSLGYTREELFQLEPADVDSYYQPEQWSQGLTELRLHGSLKFESRYRTKDGRLMPVDVVANHVQFGVDELICCVVRDISERKRAEEENTKLAVQLQQANKMEAIGTLAGGVAHDFNNILSAVIGYAELIRVVSPAGSDTLKYVAQILKAGTRAKQLVRQILAFSHQSGNAKTPLQPAPIIKEAVNMLRASIPTTITIKQEIDSDVGTVMADPTQIHQIVLNLCTNAFHAMEMTGGTITISLCKKKLTQKDLSVASNLQPGEFVQLSIKDTGKGVAPDIRSKIFDPFFTTKEVGKGTGLGLSTVHGIVKSYGGAITLDSNLGGGTVFTIILPIVEDLSMLEDEYNTPVPTGNENILLVDDEEMLVELGQTMLEGYGYNVTARRSSYDALAAFENQPNAYDMVITDQTMPGMTGIDLAQRILQIRPEMPIILCTGYSSNVAEEKVKSLGIRELALKPLALQDLACLVRKILDEK